MSRCVALYCANLAIAPFIIVGAYLGGFSKGCKGAVLVGIFFDAVKCFFEVRQRIGVCQKLSVTMSRGSELLIAKGPF